MSKSKITPVRKQYLELKDQYPGAILFFRLGDFYETFDEDAELVARELDIVLTSRSVGKGTRVPMAGVPHHAADSYLARLVGKGHHVAICEQVGDGPVNGLFSREVVRVITPGTLLEAGLVPSAANNFLAAVLFKSGRAGIAYADVSTGEFAATEIISAEPHTSALQEIYRLDPAEVLFEDQDQALSGMASKLSAYPAFNFDFERASKKLMDHFQTSTLDGFGMSEMPSAVGAAGALLSYVEHTQSAALGLLTSISTYTVDDFMTLDTATRRNLELTQTLRDQSVDGSLLGVLDKTRTPGGARMLRRWMNKPLIDIQAIAQRHDLVSAFHLETLVREQLRQALRPIGDLERINNRIVAGVALPRDLVALRENLQLLPGIEDLLANAEADTLSPKLRDFDRCQEVLNILDHGLADEPPATLASIGIIRRGYAEVLDSLYDASKDARAWIDNLETVERERTAIPTLKVGFNKVFGYYIEVTKANVDQVPDDYIRKQTLVNAERYITPDMKEYEAIVLSAEDEIKALEVKLFGRLCAEVAEFSTRVLATAALLSLLDVTSNLAEIAVENRYVAPELLDEPVLDILAGRHPVVERYLGGGGFVPNDTIFDKGERIRIITGPNMSGKSTYLRQVALILLMAQMGSFVPADYARIGIADRIFTRIGAQDEIHAGQSTFMVEMVETANILNHATDRSLLVLDEIGRGTSTYDGLSIAWAVVEHIHNNPDLHSRTLFATHYHELTSLADYLPSVCNFNIAVAEMQGTVTFLHEIRPGPADKSYGIHVADLAGMPPSIIQRAAELLHRLESDESSPSAFPGSKSSEQQLQLFEPEQPIVDELKKADLNQLSPLEALNLLFELKGIAENPESEPDNHED